MTTPNPGTRPAHPRHATDAPADGTTAPADEGDGEDVTLTLLIDNTEVTVAQTDALTQAFTELHPNITFDIEQRPGGGDGDNIVKTRLSTESMSDVFSTTRVHSSRRSTPRSRFSISPVIRCSTTSSERSSGR